MSTITLVALNLMLSGLNAWIATVRRQTAGLHWFACGFCLMSAIAIATG